MAISRQVIIHEGPGGSFESMWVGDAEGGTKPGILLFPNILGTKEWDFAKAEELAALGYTVLVTDLYGQGKRGTDMESGMLLMAEINDDRTVMRTRLLDALAMLKGLPAVDTARLAVIGSALAANACSTSRGPARTSRVPCPSMASMMPHPSPMRR